MPGDLPKLGLTTQDFSALSSASISSNSTGVPEMDRALGRALVRIAKAFDVNPSFAFLDDEQAPNAYASAETSLPGTWGTVVFGRRLFREQMARYKDNGMSVLAIVAHEFGHIVQFSRNLSGDLRGREPTVRKIELHADFLSGWYLGTRKKVDKSITLWASGDTFNRIGDYQYNAPQHHGTPAQRVAAAEAGFSLGSRETTVSIDEAVEAGRRFVGRIA